MNVLILTNYNFDNSFSIDPTKCFDRLSLYSYFIGNYLIKNNFNVIYRNIPHIFYSNLSKNSSFILPDANFIIIVNHFGIKKFSPLLVDILHQKYNKIIVVANSYTFKYNEHLLISFGNNNNFYKDDNIKFFNWSFDDDFFFDHFNIKKKKNSINILIGDNHNTFINKYNKINLYDLLLDKIKLFKKNNSFINVNITQISFKFNNIFVSNLHIDNKTLSISSDPSKKISFFDLYHLLSISHIYFITHNSISNYFLSELNYFNILIVSPQLWRSSFFSYFNTHFSNFDNSMWKNILRLLNNIKKSKVCFNSWSSNVHFLVDYFNIHSNTQCVKKSCNYDSIKINKSKSNHELINSFLQLNNNNYKSNNNNNYKINNNNNIINNSNISKSKNTSVYFFK